MSVEAQTVEYAYTGDGVSTIFPFPSKFLSNSDLIVGFNGVLQLSGYTVAGAENNLGGTVTFATAPANGVRVLLLRKPPPSQLIDFVNGQSVLENTLDNGLDKLTMIVQYLLRGYARSIKVGDLNTSPPDGTFDLPGPSARADKWLRFGPSGEVNLDAPGPVFAITGGTTFSNRLAATLATVAAGVGAFTLAGYNTPGDGGAGTYIRLSAPPGVVRPWHIQTLDGAYWELTEQISITPEMFGAKRDNATDDGPAWNTAIAYANEKGGREVVGLPGSYKIATRLELLSNVKLRSLLKHESSLVAAASIAGGHVAFADRQSHVTVEDFNIIGNYAGSGQSNHGIIVYGGAYIDIRGNIFQNIEGCAVLINGSFGVATQRVTVRENYISGCYWGVTVFKYGIDVQIKDNVIDGARNHAILVDDATTSDNPANSDPLFKPAPNFRVAITGNIITNAATSSIGAGIAASGTKNLTIANNQIKVVGVSGAGGAVGIVCNSGQAYYNDTTDITITGNQIDTIYMGPAIQMAGANRFAITGNNIHSVGLGAGASSMSVVQILDDNASGFHTSSGIVEGNTLIGNAAATIGVYFGAGAYYCRCGSNNFVGLVTDVRNDDGGGSNMISFTGRGTLPPHIAGWHGRLWVDNSHKVWVSNNAAWVGVGTQT